MMNRRSYLKQMMAATGGLVALPSWAGGWTVGMLPDPGSFFSPDEFTLLSSVADTIIPPGNAIGALSVGVDVFLQKLFQDCYEEDVQDNIKQQLKGLNEAARSAFESTFPECDQLRRQELLLSLSVSNDKAMKDFFELVKSETIRGFRTSKEVLLNYLNYQVVPGHYHGCVDVNV
jgi:hypothetical protein